MSAARAALVLLVALVAPAAAVDESRSLYLWRSPTDERLLEPVVPTGTTAREESLSVGQNETVTFGPFSTDPALATARLGRQPILFSVFLATGAAGMPNCAEVAFTLVKTPASGPAVPLASASVLSSLVPKASLTDPIVATAAMADDPAARTLAAGDRIALTIGITNRCTDGAHIPRLLYDAAARPSRLAFTDSCPNVANPDQTDTDDDGIGDRCDICPLVPDPDQDDRDGDGFGSACDACPDEPGEAGEARGCPCTDANCDDGDACTIDACVTGSGCSHERLADFAFVECRVLALRQLLVDARDVDAVVKRSTSAPRRALKRTGRAVLRAERARAHASLAGYLRRVDEVARGLRRFERAVADAERAGLVSSAIHAQLAALTAETLDALPH